MNLQDCFNIIIRTNLNKVSCSKGICTNSINTFNFSTMAKSHVCQFLNHLWGRTLSNEGHWQSKHANSQINKQPQRVKLNISNYQKKNTIPAFSITVLDQFMIVYTERRMAPTGSIHQQYQFANKAAARPTTLVRTSKE